MIKKIIYWWKNYLVWDREHEQILRKLYIAEKENRELKRRNLNLAIQIAVMRMSENTNKGI